MTAVRVMTERIYIGFAVAQTDSFGFRASNLRMTQVSEKPYDH